MRILVLATESPVPATSGVRLRTLHLARALAELAEVEVAALGDPGDATDEPFRLVGVPHGDERWRALARSAWTPYMAAKLSSSALARHAASARADVAQAEFPFTVPAAREARIPIVLDAHNVESDLLKTLARSESRPVHRLRWRWEAAKTERYERRVLATVDAVCATSEDDASVLEDWGARRVVVVPNGVDTGAVAFGGPSAEPTIAFVGHFGYRPNELAALELAADVFPRIQGAVPDARLLLIGRAPSDALRRLAGPAVEVTGEVVDVLAHLRRARVVVLPLRSGSGTRLKALEAMAAGIPIVTTCLGLSGIDVVDDTHVLFAETPEELAAQAVRILADDELARTLAREARALVERRYDWRVAALPLVELHLDLGGGA